MKRSQKYQTAEVSRFSQFIFSFHFFHFPTNFLQRNEGDTPIMQVWFPKKDHRNLKIPGNQSVKSLQPVIPMSENKIEAAYDEVLYDSLPHLQGNLRFLETVADLFGIGPTDINACRVLELGTATGKTIIPQAEEFPGSEFLGVDLSELQINAGKELIRTLGLKNIELHHLDMMELDESWGRFDYIISHGVYSWIPPAVQEKMLEICRTNLKPNGVAMISYNTYPGWHFKEYTRNVMRFHALQANEFGTPEARTQQARAILNFATAFGSKSKEDAFRKHLVEMQEHIKAVDDYYLYHEYLEPVNEPCYFLDFCGRLHAKELKHFSDFEWTNHQSWLMDPDIKKLIEQTGSPEISEQYLDFLVNRPFRCSMICREGVPTRLRPGVADRYSFYVPNDCSILEVEIDRVRKWALRRGSNMEITYERNATTDLFCMSLDRSRSRYFTLQNIWETMVALGGANILSGGALNINTVGSMIEHLSKYGILKPILHAPGNEDRDARRPYTRAFTRQMAKKNAKALSNSTFEILRLDDLSAMIIKELDGRHLISDIVSSIQKEVRSGRLKIHCDGTILGPEQRDKISTVVENTVKDLHQKRLVLD